MAAAAKLMRRDILFPTAAQIVGWYIGLIYEMVVFAQRWEMAALGASEVAVEWSVIGHAVYFLKESISTQQDIYFSFSTIHQT